VDVEPLGDFWVGGGGVEVGEGLESPGEVVYGRGGRGRRGDVEDCRDGAYESNEIVWHVSALSVSVVLHQQMFHCLTTTTDLHTPRPNPSIYPTCSP
jgi:hypothetical protein